MPTIVDALIDAYFTRPEVGERMKRVETAFAAFMKNMERLFEPIGAATLAIAKSPPSPGYEPFFVRRGADPVLARMMALVLVHRGRRIEAESRRHRAVVEAVRFLAKPGRRSSSIVRRATVLLAAWNESSAIESIFRNAPRNSIMEFAEALKGAATGDVVACERVMAIAAVFLLHLSNPPGPKISAASAAHEFFLEGQAENGRPSGYTWNPIDQEFVDELTIATRREFANPDFDPRPAHRRFKARESDEGSISAHFRIDCTSCSVDRPACRNKLN